jgi:dethiobiotin synthetase
VKHRPHRVVIVGTGTGVGKTHAGVALLLAAGRCGFSAVGLKPIESGVEAGGLGPDGALLAEAALLPSLPPYLLQAPISPHLAAAREGRVISLDVAAAWIDENARAQLNVIETAGGLLSPLGRTVSNVDLMLASRPDSVILVSIDRLGVLHDVAACLLALRVSGLEVPIVALHQPEMPDASTGTNAVELRSLHDLRVLELGRGAPAQNAEALVPFVREHVAQAPG